MAVADERGGRERTGLAVCGGKEGWGGTRKRFVFKWGLEVGEIDRLCLHTTEERGRWRSVFD